MARRGLPWRALLAAPLLATGHARAAERLRFDDLYSGWSVTGLRFSERAQAVAGFMAPPLKAEADFFVLTREPLSMCPFCSSDAEWPPDIVAAAADAFNLVVGAPGSATQLVLTSVYFQPDTVPLMDGAVLARVMAEPEAVWASPIGFGDQWRGRPIVGVTDAFATGGGRRAPWRARCSPRKKRR